MADRSSCFTNALSSIDIMWIWKNHSLFWLWQPLLAFHYIAFVLLADPQTDRKGKKLNSSGNEGSLVEASGYNPKRQEFDPEYDNDAEQLLAEMEFKDTDTEDERELKLRVLRIYSKR